MSPTDQIHSNYRYDFFYFTILSLWNYTTVLQNTCTVRLLTHVYQCCRDADKCGCECACIPLTSQRVGISLHPSSLRWQRTAQQSSWEPTRSGWWCSVHCWSQQSSSLPKPRSLSPARLSEGPADLGMTAPLYLEITHTHMHPKALWCINVFH